jgi:hypothetical protein
MQESPPGPPAPPATLPKISTLALGGMCAIAFVILASIYGFILFTPGVLTAQLWWMGVVSLIFALAFFFVYAATDEKRIVKPVAAAFFVIGAASFYGSIGTTPNSGVLQMIWFVILSVFVIMVLGWIYWSSRQEERDVIRRSQRRLTP